jgi:hypothetical protein
MSILEYNRIQTRYKRYTTRHNSTTPHPHSGSYPRYGGRHTELFTVELPEQVRTGWSVRLTLPDGHMAVAVMPDTAGLCSDGPTVAGASGEGAATTGACATRRRLSSPPPPYGAPTLHH